MKILDRYILKELIGPLIFGIIIFTTLMVAGGILFKLVKLMVEQNVSALVAGKLFFLGLPQIIAYTLPMSVLLACLLTFSRLSSDKEIMAMKAGGISLYSVSAPVLIIALLVSLLTIIFNETVVPQARQSYEKIMWEEVNKGLFPQQKEDIFIREFKDNQLQRFLYAKVFDQKTKTLKKVVDMEFEKGHPVRTINAQSAKWDERGWHFTEGVVNEFSREGRVKHIVEFKRQKIELSRTPEDIASSQKKPEDMGIRELKSQIMLLKEEGIKVKELLVELYLKITVPIASFIFALIGFPLGIKSQRSSSSLGVGLSALIIFAYYVVMTLSSTWGKAGYLSPLLSAWMANIIFGVIGLGLLVKAAR